MLVTYLTSDPKQQQNALDRAKLVEPQNARILQREQALFGQRKTTGSFVPDLNLSQQTVESRGSARSGDLTAPMAPDRPSSQAPQSVPRPSQPLSQQRPMPSGEHIPTLADGIVLKIPLNLLTYFPILAALGGIAACILLAVGYNAVMQSRFQRAPNAIVSTPVPSNTGTPDSTQSGIAQTVTALAQVNVAPPTPTNSGPTLLPTMAMPGYATVNGIPVDQQTLGAALTGTYSQAMDSIHSYFSTEKSAGLSYYLTLTAVIGTATAKAKQ